MTDWLIFVFGALAFGFFVGLPSILHYRSIKRTLKCSPHTASVTSFSASSLFLASSGSSPVRAE